MDSSIWCRGERCGWRCAPARTVATPETGPGRGKQGGRVTSQSVFSAAASGASLFISLRFRPSTSAAPQGFSVTTAGVAAPGD